MFSRGYRGKSVTQMGWKTGEDQANLKKKLRKKPIFTALYDMKYILPFILENVQVLLLTIFSFFI